MKILRVNSLSIPEIKVIRFARFSDLRGYFTEPFRRSDFTNHPEMHFMKGISFVQENESFSKSNVLRGLHFQWNPFMGKLVRTIKGHMIDIICDIRKTSPTYGKVILYDMPSCSNYEYGEWIWIPPGFAHGNYFIEETTIEYLCSGEYSQGCEAGLSPLSPDLEWDLCDINIYNQLNFSLKEIIMSDKDRAGLTLKQWTEDPRSENFIYNHLKDNNNV
jgi:dTDP-4-dehydrorhamnose 3,5-epimerase